MFYINKGTGVFAFYKHFFTDMDDCNFLFAEGRASALQTCAANPEYCGHPDVLLPALPLN